VPNTGLTGIVRDESGRPVEGLGVRVRLSSRTGRYAILAVARWVAGGLESTSAPRLGEAVTGPGGTFSIHYGALDGPDLDVILHTLTGRRLDVRRFAGVIDQTLDLGTWTVRNRALGWVATQGVFTPTDGNEVELLIDNHEAWSRAISAVSGAQKSINFMLFYLDIKHAFMAFDPDPPRATGVGPTHAARLELALKAAADQQVKVRLLLNNLGGIPYPFDTANVVTQYFAETANVETRWFTNFPVAPVHAKVMILDDIEAYEFGSPFVQDYYDDVGHSLHDPRHGERRLSKGINVPTHDVSTRIRGPAVKDLNETFRLHWNQVKPGGATDLPAAPTPPPVAQGVTAQITRSLWGGGRFTALPDGEASILESYLRAIERAESYIYLENQYFTLRELTEALIAVLTAKPDLKLIILTNNKVDIPGYNSWHPNNITRLLSGLRPDNLGQVGVFTRWSHERGLTPGARDRVGRNYTHSKVAVVDDIWATVGSANLDGVSLLASEHAYYRPEVAALVSNDDEIRETDVNLVVLDRDADGNSPTALPAELRKRLFAEHLGFLTTAGRPDANAPELQTPPKAGWLSLWTQRAAANVEALRAGIGPNSCRIMPWPNRDGVTIRNVSDPRSYLDGLGVGPSAKPPVTVEIVDTFDYYSFAEDTWKS